MHDRSTAQTPRLLAVALVALLVAVSGGIGTRAVGIVAAQGAASPVAFEGSACPFTLPVFLVDGGNVSCGYVTVPERHAEPEGATLRLAVAVLASTGDAPAAEPLILLNGGPGQPSEPVLSAFDPGAPLSLAPMLERQDVILFDQRGTGYSEPALYCSTDVAPSSGGTPVATPVPAASPVVGEQPTDADLLVQSAIDCREELTADGIDLESYTTVENAADVDDLRVALGHETVDLLGISYGSRLALTVMRDFPGSARSVVLGSPLPPQADQVAGQLVAFDAALQRVFDGCAADPRCAELNPDLPAAFAAAYERLEVEPFQVAYRDLATGEPAAVPVDGDAFVSLVYLSVFAGPLLPAVPPLITSAAARVPDVMAIIIPFVELFGAGFSTGMLLAVNCQDEVGFSSLESAREQVAGAGVRPELAGGAGLGELGFYEACDALGTEPEGGRENEPVASEIPTLILTGAYDPITPTTYGERALETLSNGTLVEIGSAGHDPLTTGGPCPVSIAVAFLADPSADVDASCAEGLVVDYSP